MNEPTGKCNGECPNGTLPNNAFTYPKINEKIVNNKWWTSYSDQ